MMIDQIDRVAGLTADNPLAALRRQRPDFVDGAESCRIAVLDPRHDNNLPRPLRAALAARMARHNNDAKLAAEYDRLLACFAPADTLLAIAAGNGPQADARIAAIVAHTDLVTLHPRDSRRADIEALAAAGLDEPAIVALSELIAFVNTEARIIAGLRLLETLA